MTSIKCGNCTSTHESVSAVRSCYGQTPVASRLPNSERTMSNGKPMAPAVQDEPQASEKQVAFVASLREQKGLEALPFTGSKRQGSTEITRLLALPRVSAPEATAAQRLVPGAVVLPTVPAGRYAIDAEGTVKFYRIDCPTDGRWAGRTFVKVQASDEFYPVRGASATTVLQAIAQDPAAASLRYGRLVGACGKCGRTLTDEDSRARGIGPICAAKSGW